MTAFFSYNDMIKLIDNKISPWIEIKHYLFKSKGLITFDTVIQFPRLSHKQDTKRYKLNIFVSLQESSVKYNSR